MKSLLLFFTISVFSCGENTGKTETVARIDSIGPSPATVTNSDTSRIKSMVEEEKHPFENVNPDSLVSFAKTLIGIPYLYASTDPKKGFDCSGFITYVFKHFNLSVPRSSVDFTNYGREIPKELSRPGDLILFTGTDSTIRIVGHMGIVVENVNGQLSFIHSSSGKANGVVITPLGKYYMGRFVKVIRVFPDHFFRNG